MPLDDQKYLKDPSLRVGQYRTERVIPPYIKEDYDESHTRARREEGGFVRSRILIPKKGEPGKYVNKDNTQEL